MAEINLLKNELKPTGPFSWRRWQGVASLYVVGGIAALLVVGYLALLYYQGRVRDETRQIQQTRAELDLELEQIEQERLSAVSAQRRLRNLGALLQHHVFWSELLSELEEFTFAGVTYQSLQVETSEGNKLVIAGRTPTLTDVAKFLAGLQEAPHVMAIDLQQAGQAEEELAGFNFSVEVTFDPGVLNP